MKLLPWTLLSLILVCSVVFGQAGPTTSQGKIFGIPAAAEWLEIESGANNQPGTQFQVPPGRVLTLVYLFNRASNTGSIDVRVDIDGTVVSDSKSIVLGALTGLYEAATPSPFLNGETAAAGQIVTVKREGGTAIDSNTFALRGWLEPLP